MLLNAISRRAHVLNRDPVESQVKAMLYEQR